MYKRLHLRQICSGLLVGVMFLLSGSSAFGDPLPQSEIIDLNTKPNYVISSASCTSSGSGGSVTLVGNGNAQKTWNFLSQKGLGNTATAAVMGNIQQESQFNPEIMQKGGSSQNPSDADPLGWGLAQWTPGSKTPGLAATANVTGPIYELGTQLQLIWAEMNGTAPTGYQNVTGGLKSQSSLAGAVEFFRANFEGGTPGMRLAYAQQALTTYGGSQNSGTTPNTPSDNGSCSGGTAINCPTSSAATASSSTSSSSSSRTSIVCIAQSELALWKSQPGYNEIAGHNFPYAETGYEKYTQGRHEEWCADFASWIYYKAGDPLQSNNQGNVPGVSSIQAIGMNGGKFTYHDQSTNYVPQPGDLAIHNSSHVNIFISSSGGISNYIGGDQYPPPYPGGSVVSTATGKGYYDNGISGYVSPN